MAPALLVKVPHETVSTQICCRRPRDFQYGILGFIQLTQSKPKAEVRETIPSVWRVAVQQVLLQTVSPVFNGFGSVQNPDTQTLKARISTDIAGLYAREGTRAVVGQLLMKLDATDAEIKLSHAKANLADAQAGLIALNTTEIKTRHWVWTSKH